MTTHAPAVSAGGVTTDGRDQVLVRLALLIAAIAVLCSVAVVPLHYWVAARAQITPIFWADPLLGSVWPTVGAIVVRSRPRNLVGWLMLIAAPIGPYLLLAHYAAVSTLVTREPLPGATFAAWVGAWGYVPYFFTLPLVSLFFPDGRLPSRRWRLVVGMVLGMALITTVTAMLAPRGLDVADQIPNPLGIPGTEWWIPVLFAASFTTTSVGVLLGVLSLILRLRRAVGVQRSQLQWLLLGSLVLLLGVGLTALRLPADMALVIAVLGPPLGIAIAMLRHRLFDVEVVLNRSIVYLVLTLIVVGVYGAAVFGVQVIAPGSTLGVIVVAAAALLAAGARGKVQLLVDRVLFGYRHDPYAVVAQVGRHVAAASEPVQALQRLVEALRTALRVPYVTYLDSLDTATVSAGEPVDSWRVIPARALGQQIGELRVGLRRGAPRWTAEEQAAIDEVATRAATLAYAAGLVADVARSRERIVVAREEERRRLRADLHDGVGPTLAGAAHQLGALARRIEATGHPELANRARDLRDRLRGTVAEIRSVVHGLRPPVLDQLGLAGGLRQLVTGYDTPQCSAMVEDLGTLPAAVEVAAYSIAAEAVTNAVRHSAARRVSVQAVRGDQALVVEVRDDGCGMPTRPAAGVGLHSMGERAAEVGGRIDITAAHGGGTVVRAELPVGTP